MFSFGLPLRGGDLIASYVSGTSYDQGLRQVGQKAAQLSFTLCLLSRDDACSSAKESATSLVLPFTWRYKGSTQLVRYRVRAIGSSNLDELHCDRKLFGV